MVLTLRNEGRLVRGIIIEVQLSTSESKKSAWPAYIANLRARIRCPVSLVIITIEESVERWAGQPIDLGDGNHVVPSVLGPTNVPVITDLSQAEANVELAVLSAVVHGNDNDILRAARVASVAIAASAGLDEDRATLYFDLILKTLSEGAQRALSNMNPGKWEYMSDFARHYVARGKEEGMTEGQSKGVVQGRAEVVLQLLTLRCGPLSELIQTRIQDACRGETQALLRDVLKAESLQDVLSAI